jgi:hypothetical protein
MAAHTSLFFLLPHARMLFLHFFPILMSASSNLGSFLLFLPGIRRRHSGRLKRAPAGRGLAQKPAPLCPAGTGEEHNRQSELAEIRDDAGDGQVQDTGRIHAGKNWAQGCRPGRGGRSGQEQASAGRGHDSTARPGHHGAAGIAWRGRDSMARPGHGDEADISLAAGGRETTTWPGSLAVRHGTAGRRCIYRPNTEPGYGGEPG